MSKGHRANGQLVIQYGAETIPFELAFRPRRELSINVHPDRSVSVVAPEARTIEEVLARVRRKAAWIVKQRRHFERFHPLPRRDDSSPERRTTILDGNTA